METRASFALIGASLIIGLSALAAFVIWLGQLQFNRGYAEYNVIFDGAVNGLSEGGQVRYLGISVGEVTELSISETDNQQVIARIRIESETPIRDDSKALLNFAGLTGVTFIQIQPGTQASPLMPKRTGDNLPTIESERTQLEAIFEGGQDLMTDAQMTISRINSLLDQENAEEVKQILQNINAITSALAQDEDLLDSVTVALRSLAEAGDAVGQAAESFNTVGTNVQVSLADLTAEAKNLLADARHAVGTAETAIVETQDGLGKTIDSIQVPTAQVFEEINRLASEMRLLIRRLDGLAREIEQNPQSFIQGQPKPYREPVK
ncbi:MAG: hypothetical protein CMK07_01300 [Ponticaulis sp.]|nr:hypothetical protein [Ponticaulis sp.]